MADALDQVEEPLPLQILVEVIGAIGEKRMIYRLKDLIIRIGAKGAETAEANGFDPLQRVRAKARARRSRRSSPT